MAKPICLIGGNSFSATSLFAQSVRPEENVTIVGEETGGGAYGNSAWTDTGCNITGNKECISVYHCSGW